jgi:FixJ family two-component response regulator
MPKRMKSSPALVAVVDDDESVVESLPDLLRELGFAAVAFGSANEFLASADLALTRCLLLDVAMPGMSGPELVACLFKPFSEQELRAALAAALPGI